VNAVEVVQVGRPSRTTAAATCAASLLGKLQLHGTWRPVPGDGSPDPDAMALPQAFPGREGLARFRAWVESPDAGLLEAARTLAGEEAGQGEL
jgi:hypothetical protein